MYGNLRTLVSEADSSIAAIHSIQHEKDWFDNPIETTGQFSGVVIDARKEEVLILAPTEAIETADRRIRANVNFDLTMELLAMTIKFFLEL